MFGPMTPPPPRDQFWPSTRGTRPARSLVSAWAQARRRNTPWAYPRLRALAATRFAVGIFLIGLGAVLVSFGHAGLAVIPLAGAALVTCIAGLDIGAAHAVAPRASRARTGRTEQDELVAKV